ncbi:septum formation initiator family protein [Rhodoplanes sp. TEM]|uniref:Septum formation initiator family protein n=1 Tax=Rhodoplanes tepidamans TaxID=200616 RepID=A0ABT5JJT7_RHOTP|nr:MULTISPECIES: septum formation initiator family protein [Rhodoplanes]MDC7789839.1 septum formation initiator family protein [Rhodoplanes tepidamans]MDC7987572.1 septum formation initiator family protein [Rhodoplanes sp. TEM]MDQ0359213.1 cell division protein FtsB [Rhodoplanes tepidamans]
MVSRPRIRSIVTALCLYVLAALMIGYFGINAYTGSRGINARKDLDAQIAELTAELAVAKAEREVWQRRVSLLKSESLDPDLLDERARALLNYVDHRDVVMIVKAR